MTWAEPEVIAQSTNIYKAPDICDCYTDGIVDIQKNMSTPIEIISYNDNERAI